MNRVAVVVLNWNGASLLSDCLDSLLAQDHPDFSVIVVDNHSTDNSKEVLEGLRQKSGERLQIIYNNRNSGFAGGVNIGIRQAMDQGYDMIALFNNDAVAEPNWLSQLVAAIENDPTVGIATGLLLHADGQTIDSTGDFYSIWGLAFPRNRDQATDQAPESGFVFGATGGASLYRIELLKQIGLFDEAFFAYYEDVDLSFRAQLAGWKVYYTKTAVAHHKRGATSDKIPGFAKYQMFKNLPLLFWKNVPRGLLWKIGLRFKLIYTLMFINALLQGNAGPALKGAATAIARLPYALTKRLEIQRQRRCSVSYINGLLYQDLPPTQKGRLRKLVGRGAASGPTADEEPVEAAKG